MNTPTFLPDIKHPAFGGKRAICPGLGEQLGKFARCGKPIVLAMPTSSLALATEIAAGLHCHFEVLLVVTITVPGGGGYPIGALTSNDVLILNEPLIELLHLCEADVSAAIRSAATQLARRERFYHGTNPALGVADHTVILVDDGTTPAATLRDAIQLLRRQGVAQIIVALPAASAQDARELRLEADEVVVW